MTVPWSHIPDLGGNGGSSPVVQELWTVDGCRPGSRWRTWSEAGKGQTIGSVVIRS